MYISSQQPSMPTHEGIMSQRVTDMSCTKKCCIPKVIMHIKFDDEDDPMQELENWENKLPIIESNCNVKFSLVHLLYTSDSHYTFCSFCSHHKCVEVINDPGGSTAPLWYITHGSLKEGIKRMGSCNAFFPFFFKKKAAVLLCTQTLQPKGWISLPSTGWYN